MKKAIIIILAALMMLSVFVACNQDDIIDDLLGYSVTFDANGGEGTMESQRIPADGADLNANAFTYTDHTFTEWNTKADGTGTAYKDKGYIKLTSSITLYAQWIHNEAKIAFSANGGEGSMETLTVKTNTPVELPASTLSWDGHVFYGWNTKADGSGTFYGDGAVIYVAADTILYAQWWQPTVSFDANGGTGSMPDQAVDFNIATELDSIGTAITREGYHFTEWNTEKEGTGDHYNDGDEITITEDMILYAQWNPNTYVVSFDANGGSEVKKTIEVTYDSEYGELPTTIKAGSEFLGWVTEDGELVEEDTVVAIAEDHVLTAYWDAMTYKISYETNGGTINSGKVEEYTYGIGATLPTDVTKDGNEFGGWYKNAEFKGKVITEVTGKEVGDKTFYARWLVVYLDDKTTEWTDGYTYTLADGVTALEIPNRITVTGDVTLILPDGMTLTASKGITVSDGNNLTIEGGKEGTGILLIDNVPDNYAGIGGTSEAGETNGGTITINGGTVNATAGEGINEAIGKGNGGTDSGKLIIGEGQGLYGGDDETTAKFISAPTDDYDGNRFKYMYAEATEYVTVTFKPNGAKETEDKTQKVPSGVDAELMANPFTHETLFFAGWALSPDGDIVYADQASVNLTEDTPLYAKWIDAISLDNTYGGNEGKKLTGGLRYTIADNLTLPGRLSIDGTSEVTLILPEGKTLTLEKGLNVVSGQSLVIEGEGTLNATGSSLAAGIGGDYCDKGGTITIKGGTINATGGDCAAGIGGGMYGEGGDVTILGGTVTAFGDSANYAVAIGHGYFATDEDDGTLEIGDGLGLFGGADKDHTEFLSGPVESYAGSHTAYMETKATTYVTVTFDGNGATSGTMDPQLVPSGFAQKLNANEFEKTDYSFVKWNTKADGTGTSYADTEEVSLSADTTLYAQWANGIVLTNQYVWEDGKTYLLTNSDLSLDENRITVNGNVRLMLLGTNKLTASKGINVTGDNTLTIDGTGSLIAQGGNDQSGIGGGANEAGGTVNIYGGNVNATGGLSGAGIGGGVNSSGGTVNIYDGNVTAKGGSTGSYGGAGIGGGCVGAGGEVHIYGGTVTAIGGGNTVGIGKGEYSTDSQGTLEIGTGFGLYGGADEATAKFVSAPIEEYEGDRYAYMAAEATVCDVTVTFEANTGTGTMAAMPVPSGVDAVLAANKFTKTDNIFAVWNTKSDGSGESYADKATINITENTTLYAQWIQGIDLNNMTEDKYAWTNGNTYVLTDDLNLSDKRITITGTVKLYLLDGTTLTVPKGISVISPNTLTIDGEGTLTVKGGDYQAGIGGGQDEDGGTIIIDGGIINATGGPDAAGIGGGDNGSGGIITINAGTVVAKGSGYAAGIGSGFDHEGGKELTGGTITFNGGTVNATGGSNGAGIGGGYRGNGGTVTINGGTVTATGKGGSTGIGKGETGADDGKLTIGTGLGLYGGADKDSAVFLSGATESYEDERPVYMEAEATTTYFTITFDPNSAAGGSGTMDPQTVPEGKPAKLNANTFTHASLVFGCWNTKADGSGTSYADTAAIKATEDTTLYAMWVDTFTVDVSTVLANRQQNVATTEGGLHPTVRKYVMVADGPVYSDPAMTQAVTTVSGSGTWKNVAYNGGNGYALNASGSGQTYYKDEDTSVIVIYQIYYGAWSSALVKQDAMSSWGNPSAAGFDKSLYTSIGISTNVWSGTPAIGNNMGRMLSVGSGYWSVDVTSETWSRIQTSLFK